MYADAAFGEQRIGFPDLERWVEKDMVPSTMVTTLNESNSTHCTLLLGFDYHWDRKKASVRKVLQDHDFPVSAR